MEIEWYQNNDEKQQIVCMLFVLYGIFAASNMEFYCVVQFNIVHQQRHITNVISWDSRVRGSAKFVSVVLFHASGAWLDWFRYHDIVLVIRALSLSLVNLI